MQEISEAEVECKRSTNLAFCNCSYPHCDKKGICCECIKYHRERGELPACFFPSEAERTYDRSIGYFIKIHTKGKGA